MKTEIKFKSLTIQELLQLDPFNTLSDADYTTDDQLQTYKHLRTDTYSSALPSITPNSNSILLAEFHDINDGVIINAFIIDKK